MALLWRLGKTALKWKRTVGKWPNTSHLIRLSANVVYSTEDFMHFLSNSTVPLHHSISPARHLFYFPGWNVEGWPCSADCLGGALKESYLLLQQMWMIFREMLTLYCESLSLSGKIRNFPLSASHQNRRAKQPGDKSRVLKSWQAGQKKRQEILVLVLIRGETNLSLSGLFSCYGSTDTIMGREEKFSQIFENTNLCYLSKGNNYDDNRRERRHDVLSSCH